MAKLMYDSVNASLIPTNAAIVAGYADGRYQWSSADWARFPNATKVTICCFAGSQADILDIETGCASPSDVPSWLDRYDRPVFKVPTLYVNRGNWDAVKAQVGSRQVDYWVATLDSTQVVPGAAAVQYTDTGAYDISVCQDFWPRTKKETKMLMLHPPTGLGVLVSGDLVVQLPADGTTEALQAAGVQVVNVTQAFFDNVMSAAAVVQGSVKGSLNVSGLLNVARGVGA